MRQRKNIGLKIKELTLKAYSNSDAVASATSFAIENIKVSPKDLKRKKELESKYPLK